MVKSDDRKSRKLSPVVVAAELRAVHAGVGRAVGRRHLVHEISGKWSKSWEDIPGRVKRLHCHGADA